MRDNLIPIVFFLFMVINIYLDKTKRKKRRQEQREQEQQNEQTQEPEIIIDRAPQEEKTPKPADLAAEFERRLKKTTEAAEAAKQKQRDRVVTDGSNVHRDDEAVVHDNKGRVRRDDAAVVRDGKRIHRDGEAAHDNSGRIHRDNESLAHDKSKVYYDPRGDYSYDEAEMNAAAAAFNAHYAKAQEPVKKPRMKLKHTALVSGFIMSQVLAKPRALEPYDGEYR